MSQRGGVAPYFQSEASRHSATIRVNPITIMQTLMDVDQSLHIFCSLVTNAQILEILSPGEEESYKERTQVMSAEFVLPLPKFQLVKLSLSGILTNNWTEAGSL